MKREIRDFYQDEDNQWVARLDCHHGQHVRHNPPFINRPWVVTPEGRAEKIGMELDCLRCDRFEFPAGLSLYKRTPEFDEVSVPAGLLRDHSTKEGVWALIRVLGGQLRYQAGSHAQVLDETTAGVIVPQMKHHVVPIGHVRFYLEFFRSP